MIPFVPWAAHLVSKLLDMPSTPTHMAGTLKPEVSADEAARHGSIGVVNPTHPDVGR